MLKINLLPPSGKAARAKRLIMLAVTAGVAVFLTIPAGVWYLKFSRVASLKAEIKALDKEAEAGGYREIMVKVDALKVQEAALAKKLDVLDKLLVRQASWIKILEALSLSQSQSKDLWLQTFSSRPLTTAPDAGKTELTLTGVAFSIASVEDFVRSFQKADFLPELKQTPVVHSATDEGQALIQFTAVFKFKV